MDRQTRVQVSWFYCNQCSKETKGLGKTQKHEAQIRSTVQQTEINYTLNKEIIVKKKSKRADNQSLEPSQHNVGFDITSPG